MIISLNPLYDVIIDVFKFYRKIMFIRDYSGVLYLCVARDMKSHELDSRENLQAKTLADMLIEYRYK